MDGFTASFGTLSGWERHALDPGSDALEVLRQRHQAEK